MNNSFLIDIAHGFSNKGPVRKINEDSFILPDPHAPTDLGLIYVVADGVGGQEHGAEASQMAVRIIHDVFYQTRQVGESIPVALAHAADQANLAIYDEAQRKQSGRMGCTVVTAVHHQGQRYLLHAGDARAYLLRHGQLQKLTRDDTWVQRQVEEGLIGEDTAQKHELRHVVTRVLGNNPTAEFTVSEPQPIMDDDVLLLCSDGLYDVVSDGEIIPVLADYGPQAAAETLVETAVFNQSQDNITTLVVLSRPSAAGEPTIALPALEEDTMAMTAPLAGPPLPEAPPARRQPGLRLPLWLLASLGLALVLAVIWGGAALFRQLRAPDEPSAPAATTDAATAVADIIPTTPPEALPTIMDTAVPPPTLTPPLPTAEPVAEATDVATAVPNQACIVSVNAFVYVWRDDQIASDSCDQYAQEGFVLDNGDAVTVLEAEPREALGPDLTCLTNEFVKVQSAADPAIAGWVLVDNVQATTDAAGCGP